jgi:hypothetical protein
VGAALDAELREDLERHCRGSETRGSSPTGNKPCRRVSRRRIVREVRAPATRYDASGVYLVRSAQYQFCNCGVLSISARRDVRLAFSTNFGIPEGKMAKKAKKAKKKTGKKKKK